MRVSGGSASLSIPVSPVSTSSAEAGSGIAFVLSAGSSPFCWSRNSVSSVDRHTGVEPNEVASSTRPVCASIAMAPMTLPAPVPS